MPEAPKKSSYDSNLNLARLYATLTDSQRMSEYAYTGDPQCLTPQLARRMRVSPEVMQQVLGASEEDVLYASKINTIAEEAPSSLNDVKVIKVSSPHWGQESFFEQNRAKPIAESQDTKELIDDTSVEEFREECLVQFGLDDKALEGKTVSEIILGFYDTARLPVEHLDKYERDNLREDIDLAIEKFADLLIHRENFVYESFHAIRLESPEGITDIETLHEAYRLIHIKFTHLSHNPEISEEDKIVGSNCAQALNEFAAVCRNFFEMVRGDDGRIGFAPVGFPPSANYLVAKYAENFLYKIGISEDAHVDQDDFAPFRISNNRAAVFSGDKKRIYIADMADSPRVNFLTDKLLQEVSYEEQGQYFARSVQPIVPGELRELVFDVIDGGTALSSGGEYGVFEEADLVDYIALLKSDTRFVIEDEFNIRLVDLSIPEQFHFLKYLKSVTLEESSMMKSFVGMYGIDGMRTFLSLERGDETLGDHIVAFGQHDEVAGTVFKYYGELLNNAERAESLVQEAGCEGEHCVQLAEQVRENIINRAQKDLESAVRAHDPSEVAAKIETYVADAKVYVALLQEAVQQPLESIPATEISEEDKEQIRALSARNYVEEPEDFQRVIRSGLESAFQSGNSRFYIERDDSGKVIFCDRFDDKVDPYNGHTVKYFGSVNAEPAFNGIGRVRITETLERELANGETMFAHCDPENAVSSLYIEHGFVATGTVSPAGKFSFEIWRSNSSNDQLQTKSLSTAELLEQFENQSESVGYEIRKVDPGDQFPELDDGKYLTRYFRQGGEYYVVFEPAPTALLAEFVPPQELREAA